MFLTVLAIIFCCYTTGECNIAIAEHTAVLLKYRNNVFYFLTEITIIFYCCTTGPQQLSPLFNSKPQEDAVVVETAKSGIEIYGFPEPSTLTLQRTDDGTDLMSSRRHSVQYTAGVSPFGVVNVTISDVVESDYTNYTLTVENGVGNALVHTFYLNEVSLYPLKSYHLGTDSEGEQLNIFVTVKSSHLGTDSQEGEQFNTTAIVIGVIAVLIIAGFIISVIFLSRKNRLLKERMNKNGEIQNEKPTLSRLKYQQLVYQDLGPNRLTSGDTGPYSNVSGGHVGNLRDTFTESSPPATNYVNVEMSSVTGNPQNKRITKQAYQDVQLK
ncbi:hypothetical protein RRG08_047598 [Elysia crispata]|uniref:Cadherin domain-containing protein n=1 Tax=Elysia crispata TaxID=231223 RepID=A0AAE0ZJD8_9GAST|nr:hypothetical protein RRG08_047598 [Elysia crispata]